MPLFIQATYNSEGKSDYALKAKIAMEGITEHPQDADYIYAYACSFLHIANQHEACVAHGYKYLPQLTVWECREHTLETMATALDALEKFDEALLVRKQLMEESATTMPEHASFYNEDLAEAYEKQGDYANAITYYEMLEKDQRDQRIYEKLGDLYGKVNDYNSAAHCYLQTAKLLSRDSTWYWSNTGRMLALAGREDEAKFYFQVAITIDPQDAYVHYYMGQWYQNKDDEYRALHHYTEALKIQPEFPEVYNNLAALSFNENGNIKEAIKNIETALKQRPGQGLLVTLYLNLSRLYKNISDEDNHKYYNTKMMEALGFDYATDEDDDEDVETGEV